MVRRTSRRDHQRAGNRAGYRKVARDQDLASSRHAPATPGGLSVGVTSRTRATGAGQLRLPGRGRRRLEPTRPSAAPSAGREGKWPNPSETPGVAPSRAPSPQGRAHFLESVMGPDGAGRSPPLHLVLPGGPVVSNRVVGSLLVTPKHDLDSLDYPAVGGWPMVTVIARHGAGEDDAALAEGEDSPTLQALDTSVASATRVQFWSAASEACAAAGFVRQGPRRRAGPVSTPVAQARRPSCTAPWDSSPAPGTQR